jgi:hypothetical protein
MALNYFVERGKIFILRKNQTSHPSEDLLVKNTIFVDGATIAHPNRVTKH